MTRTKQNDPWMTTAEVADHIRQSVETIRGRIKRGEFPKPYKLGPHPQSPNRWRMSTIDEWVESQNQVVEREDHR